ncbi:hypothetical protein H4S02_000466 [Coemansia sp. RSA 2611]|nr:hypothetical protein H4S02_000466 [Coemansia sp. RSA 2611]
MARLQWAADKPSRAAKQYLEAVCRFLGTDPGAIARIQKAGGVEDMHAQAVRIAASIPRKFAKSEDVDQALDALGEAASAQLACADGESISIQAQLGAAVYLLCHALALEKQRLDEAFQTALKLIASFHALGIRYLADGCAVLILDHHMSQPEAQMHIASAAISSLDNSDLVRSQALLRSYNHSFEEPWSRFLATVVDKTIDADVDWMSSRAMDEWSDVRLNSPQDSQRVCELIQAALLKHVEPYIWYTPAPFCSK